MRALHKSREIVAMVTAFMILLGSGVLTVASAQSSEDHSSPHPTSRITWMLSDYPPIGIAEGPQKDAGIADLLVRLVARHLPAINHHYQRANLKRMIAELEAGHEVCVPGLIQTEERKRSMYFTRVPMLLLTPLCLIVREKDRSLYGESDTVSLEEVIRNPALKLGLADGTSFGEPIDAIIERYKGEKHVYLDRSSTLKRGLLLMIASKRLDYTIGYPWMVEYLAEEIEPSGQFAMLKLKESASPIIWFAACSKSEWGLSRIREIDEVLVQVRPTPEYRSIAETWMPKESLSEYRRLYDELFLAIK